MHGAPTPTPCQSSLDRSFFVPSPFLTQRQTSNSVVAPNGMACAGSPRQMQAPRKGGGKKGTRGGRDNRERPHATDRSPMLSLEGAREPASIGGRRMGAPSREQRLRLLHHGAPGPARAAKLLRVSSGHPAAHEHLRRWPRSFPQPRRRPTEDERRRTMSHDRLPAGPTTHVDFTTADWWAVGGEKRLKQIGGGGQSLAHRVPS